MKTTRDIERPKWLRILLPSALIIIWLALGAIGGPYFGKISQVTSNDQATFLPSSAESTIVASEVKKFQDASTIPVIISFGGDSTQLTPAQIATIRTATAELGAIEGIEKTAISPPVISQDKKAALVIINLSSDSNYKALVPLMKEKLSSADITTFHISGPVGFVYDLSKAFSGIDGLLLGVALIVVFIILLIVYRSPILPFIVLLNSIFALSASILLIFYLAKAGIISISGQVQGILFILVIGAATDYALLFVSRYKEELHRHEHPHQALIASLKRSVEPIVAAGGTVTIGLLCLLLSDLNSNKALGPVGAIGIMFAIASALTLLPSLLLPWGRKVFWPRIPHFVSSTASTTPTKGIWISVANLVTKAPRKLWLGTVAALLVASLGLIGIRADGVPQSEFVLGASDARDGQAVIDRHFPGGSGTPVQIITNETSRTPIIEKLEQDRDVASIAIRADNSPSGSLPVGTTAAANPALAAFARATPKVVDGEVLIEATLTTAADSVEAQAAVSRLRNNLKEVDSSTRIGGTSAVQLDTLTSAKHDRAVVIPVVLIAITVILMLLLRSILAPVILLATTILSFAATLGISSLVFNHVFNFPGADPTVVLYAFIFLVALGIDYNIFLMTRVREEALRHGTKRGVRLGLTTTGSVITSAGIVLAATFAALGVIPILFLVQLAFIVALGVLIDTIIIRSLLVPALTEDIGRTIWWPSRTKS